MSAVIAVQGRKDQEGWKRRSAALRRRPGPAAIGFEPLFIAGRLFIEGAGAAPGRESCRFPAPLQSPASSNSYRLSGGIRMPPTQSQSASSLSPRLRAGQWATMSAPFITFFPAIIIATLVGGLWPGVCAIILSVLSAWYLFIPPAFSFALGDRELVQLLWFILFCGINLAIVV